MRKQRACAATTPAARNGAGVIRRWRTDYAETIRGLGNGTMNIRAAQFRHQLIGDVP
jgi:hypothetical protein